MKTLGIVLASVVVLLLFSAVNSTVLKAYPVPVFIWSESDRFLNAGRSWYPASSTTNDIRNLILSLSGASTETPFPLSSNPSPPEAVVLFLEPELFFGRSDLVGATRQPTQQSQLRKWKVMVEGAKSSLIVPYTYDSSISDLSEDDRSYYLVGKMEELFEDYFRACGEDCRVYVEAMDTTSNFVWSSFFFAEEKIVDLSAEGVEKYLSNNDDIFSNHRTELIIVHLPANEPVSAYDSKIESVINHISERSKDYVAVLSSDDMYVPTGSSTPRRESPIKYEWAERHVRQDENSQSPSPSPAAPGEYQYENRWPEYVWEVILCWLLLVIIFLNGICCLCGLDTPARFDNPKAKNL